MTKIKMLQTEIESFIIKLINQSKNDTEKMCILTQLIKTDPYIILSYFIVDKWTKEERTNKNWLNNVCNQYGLFKISEKAVYQEMATVIISALHSVTFSFSNDSKYKYNKTYQQATKLLTIKQNNPSSKV